MVILKKNLNRTGANKKKDETKDDSKRTEISKSELERIGVPVEFHESKAVDYSGTPKVRNVVRRYQRDLLSRLGEGRGILFTGKDDSTASMLAACIIKRALSLWKSVRYTHTEEISVAVKAAFTGYEWMYETDFLVIDPLHFGEDSVPDFIVKGVYRVLTQRRRKGLPTIICSMIPLYADDSDDERSIESVFGEMVTRVIANRCIEIRVEEEQFEREIVK